MYKYASKFSPNQMNLISAQLRHGSTILTKYRDSSGPLHQGNHVKPNLPLNLENYKPILSKTQSILNRPAIFKDRRYFVMNRTSKPDILAKYYKLTSLGKISKNSLAQNRGYASLLKKITGFFSAKPSTPVKGKRPRNCKNVKACAKKTEKKICIKPAAPPPSLINFETATKCKTEIIKDELKYIDAICPQKLEVGHKEKPPFACDGGPFLEDRLCREMPEKRCQKLLEEFDLKEERMREKAAICASPRCELKPDEIKTSVRNVKKESCRPLSDICPEISKPEFDEKCTNPLNETVCIPIPDNQLSLNKCRHVKACKAKPTQSKECDACNLKPCQSVSDCSTINEDIGIELRPCCAVESIKCPDEDDVCRNVKPCPSVIEEAPPKKDHCSNIKVCPKLKKSKSKCGLIVRPCGSAYKQLERCDSASKLKDCPKDECSNRDKCKESKCPASASCKQSKKTRSCSEEKKTTGDVCKKQQRMVTCSELKSKQDDKSKCRMTKKCGSARKSEDDKCKKACKKDGCGSGKGGSSIRCYSKSNLDPIKHYSTHNIDQFLWRDVVPAKTTKPLEEIIIKPTKYTTSNSTITLQSRELSAYSQISMKLDGTGVISMKMDVADDATDGLLLQGNTNTRRLLDPTANSGQSSQVRDSKSYAISSPNLFKLYGLKSSVPHKLGKIPELPRTARFCVSNPNLMARSRFRPQIFCAAYHGYVKNRIIGTNGDILTNVDGKRNWSSSNKTPDKKKEEEKSEETKCEPDKSACRPPPCCKKDKDKCAMPAEQLKKVLKSCSLPKAEPVKTEEKKQPAKNPCNFDQAIKAEAKHKAKELCRPPVYKQIDVCPPKKQLCCYQKKRPAKKSTKQDSECVICKKYQILDIPPKPLPKPTVCKVMRCGDRKPCSAASSKSHATSCKSKIGKREEVCPKCEKPKIIRGDDEKPKKKRSGADSACAQKKCTKKVPKPPCPDPIKAPNPRDLVKPDPCAKPCVRKPKPVMDEAAKKSLAKKCAKPPAKKPSKAGLVCDNPAVAQELARKIEMEKLEKEAREKAYAEMKHTEWKAVPVKGDNRWCKPTPVEKAAESKTHLSKTVVPTTDEKYQSPRYKKGDKKEPCFSSKKCPKVKNKHIRKLHSCPYLGQVYTNIHARSTNSVNIPRDYFENMASLIPVKETIVENLGKNAEEENANK